MGTDPEKELIGRVLRSSHPVLDSNGLNPVLLLSHNLLRVTELF